MRSCGHAETSLLTAVGLSGKLNFPLLIAVASSWLSRLPLRTSRMFSPTFPLSRRTVLQAGLTGLSTSALMNLTAAGEPHIAQARAVIFIFTRLCRHSAFARERIHSTPPERHPICPGQDPSAFQKLQR